MIEPRMFCIHEIHGGICDIDNGYCHSMCMSKELIPLSPVITCGKCSKNYFNGGKCRECIYQPDGAIPEYHSEFFCAGAETERNVRK